MILSSVVICHCWDQAVQGRFPAHLPYRTFCMVLDGSGVPDRWFGKSRSVTEQIVPLSPAHDTWMQHQSVGRSR